jgi:hypothetical protein
MANHNHFMQNIYSAMKTRCENQNSKDYKYYGGRGIRCLWKSLHSFMNDMGIRPSAELSLDRIDNNGDYCKDNCRWATKREQTINARGTKLSVYAVRLIRGLLKAVKPGTKRTYAYRLLGKLFLVSPSCIEDIEKEKTWKGIT